MKPKRTLTAIAEDIRGALKCDSANVITLGALLAEARATKRIKHGEWLPWLEREFSMSESTAQRYLQVHRFLKSRTVRDLETAKNISPTTLYELSAKSRATLYNDEVIEAIFKEAEMQRVGHDRAWDIASEIFPKTTPDIEAEIEAEAVQKADEDERAEAESILDAPAPDLPAPTETAAPLPRDQFLISTFEQGVKLLRSVMTKPASKFGAVDVTAADLKSIAGFLMQVASAMKARAA